MKKIQIFSLKLFLYMWICKYILNCILIKINLVLDLILLAIIILLPFIILNFFILFFFFIYHNFFKLIHHVSKIFFLFFFHRLAIILLLIFFWKKWFWISQFYRLLFWNVLMILRADRWLVIQIIRKLRHISIWSNLLKIIWL